MSRPAFTYTLLAYRPNAVDTCRNCVMGRSESEFEFQVFASAEELATWWARHETRVPHGREYAPFEYTVLLNGRDEDHEPSWADLPDEDLDPESGSPWFEVERIRIRELLEAERATLAAAKKAEADRLAAEAEVQRLVAEKAAAAAREARDLADLKRLTAKYGSAR